MSLTNAYCTVAEFQSLSRIDSGADQTLHEICINAASRLVDRHCGRRHGFWQDASVGTREYHPDSNWCVQVDDISTSTGLIVKTDTAVDGTFATTLTITTDFLLYERGSPNAADETPARPWDEIRITSNATNYFTMADHRPTVQVTAKFGWAAVPDEVKLATILQAQMLYSAKDARTGILQVLSQEGFATRMSRFLHPQADLLLADFVKP